MQVNPSCKNAITFFLTVAFALCGSRHATAQFLCIPGSTTNCLSSSLIYVDTIDQIVFDGVGFLPAPFDVYHFEVYNHLGVDLFTLENPLFNGPWLNASAVPIFSQVGTDLPADPFDGVVPPFGDNFTPDTFFTYTSNGSTPFADTPVDTTSSLGATTVAALGDPWIPSGATETIAVLTVPAGESLDPTGGMFTRPFGFIVSGEIYYIYVPEPGTMALAGLGLIGVMLRRRNK